jgi:hypothetical protein
VATIWTTLTTSPRDGLARGLACRGGGLACRMSYCAAGLTCQQGRAHAARATGLMAWREAFNNINTDLNVWAGKGSS